MNLVELGIIDEDYNEKIYDFLDIILNDDDIYTMITKGKYPSFVTSDQIKDMYLLFVDEMIDRYYKYLYDYFYSLMSYSLGYTTNYYDKVLVTSNGFLVYNICDKYENLLKILYTDEKINEIWSKVEHDINSRYHYMKEISIPKPDYINMNNLFTKITNSSEYKQSSMEKEIFDKILYPTIERYGHY